MWVIHCGFWWERESTAKVHSLAKVFLPPPPFLPSIFSDWFAFCHHGLRKVKIWWDGSDWKSGWAQDPAREWKVKNVLCKDIVLSAVDNCDISHRNENVETDFARFIFQEPTTLKLREKFFSFSGDDCRFLWLFALVAEAVFRLSYEHDIPNFVIQNLLLKFFPHNLSLKLLNFAFNLI